MKQKQAEIKKQLAHLKNVEGTGTQLVSLYIPGSSNINDYKQRIRQEISEAENIKSKTTMKKVKSALRSISSCLSNYKETPSNGIVVFASSEDTFLFDDLPKEVNSSIYKCDSSFYVEPLENIIKSGSEFGLVVVTENKASIGILDNNRVIERKTLKSNLQGKHNKGGQSSQRFARDRKEKKKRYFKEVGETIGRVIEETEEIVLGGPNITRKDFLKHGCIPHNFEVLGEFNVNYAGEKGLRELADRSKESLSERELNEERQILEEFYKGISKGQDAYGREKVEEYLEHGRVKTLILSEKREDTEDLAKKSRNKGGDVEYISVDFDKGEQFYETFDGIGAILRW